MERCRSYDVHDAHFHTSASDTLYCMCMQSIKLSGSRPTIGAAARGPSGLPRNVRDKARLHAAHTIEPRSARSSARSPHWLWPLLESQAQLRKPYATPHGSLLHSPSGRRAWQPIPRRRSLAPPLAPRLAARLRASELSHVVRIRPLVARLGRPGRPAALRAVAKQ